MTLLGLWQYLGDILNIKRIQNRRCGSMPRGDRNGYYYTQQTGPTFLDCCIAERLSCVAYYYRGILPKCRSKFETLATRTGQNSSPFYIIFIKHSSDISTRY